jgi:hypothetical protein
VITHTGPNTVAFGAWFKGTLYCFTMISVTQKMTLEISNTANCPVEARVFFALKYHLLILERMSDFCLCLGVDTPHMPAQVFCQAVLERTPREWTWNE